MADNLRLRVVLDLAERVLAPMKRISSSSSDAARALKAAKDRLKELNAQQAAVSYVQNQTDEYKRLNTSSRCARRSWMACAPEGTYRAMHCNAKKTQWPN